MQIGTKERIAINLAGCLFILLVLYLFVYIPKQKQMRLLQDEVRASRLKLEEAGGAVNQVSALEKEVKAIQKEMSETEGGSHLARGIPQVLEALTQGTARLDIEVISIGPLKPEKTGAVEAAMERVPVEMRISCPYRQLAEYIGFIKSLPILVGINSINIERNIETLPNLDILLLLDTFVKGEGG